MTRIALRPAEYMPTQPDAAHAAPPLHEHDRLAQARAAAVAIVAAIKARPGVPAAICEFVSGSWQRHLELIHARCGAGSQEWENSVGVTAELVLCADPDLFPSDPSGAARVFARIEGELDVGLAMTGMNASCRAQTLERLRHSLTETTTALAARIAEEHHSHALRSLDHERGADHAAYFEAARKLRVGSWIEFRHANGEIVRAKLCWASSTTGKRLFVNQHGLKYAEKTLVQLADDFAAHRAAVLVGAG